MPIIACPDCGKERKVWKYKMKRKGYTGLCFPCLVDSRKGEKHKHWKGGFTIISTGYRKVHVPKDDFFHSMADPSSYVLEHRLVMAKHLGRCLHRWEIVHHKGTKYPKGSIENKQDNRIENLQLISVDKHNQITIMERRIKQLESQVAILVAEKKEKKAVIKAIKEG